jgi:hypothetical protein
MKITIDIKESAEARSVPAHKRLKKAISTAVDLMRDVLINVYYVCREEQLPDHLVTIEPYGSCEIDARDSCDEVHQLPSTDAIALLRKAIGVTADPTDIRRAYEYLVEFDKQEVK